MCASGLTADNYPPLMRNYRTPFNIEEEDERCRSPARQSKLEKIRFTVMSYNVLAD